MDSYRKKAKDLQDAIIQKENEHNKSTKNVQENGPIQYGEISPNGDEGFRPDTSSEIQVISTTPGPKTK